MIDLKKAFAIFSSVAVMFFYTSHLPAQSINKPYYQFKKFTTDDGLITNAVHCVYKDSRGFLWIGTDRGIQRFNGSSFLTFRHLNADSNSIANEDITFIREDKQHDIWFGSRDGITKFNYNNGRLTNYRYGYKGRNAVSFAMVLSFFEDSRGRTWIGTVSAGLFLFDKAKQQFINFSPADYLGMKQDWFHFVGIIQETAKQEIVFNVSDGFVIIDTAGRQEWITVPKPKDKKIVYLPCGGAPLLKDHPNEIFITSQFNGIFKYDRTAKVWIHCSVDNPGLQDAIPWSKDEWLIGYKSIVYIFNHRTGVFTQFVKPSNTDLKPVYRDKDDNLWLTSSGGLYLLNTSNQLFSSTQHIKGWLFDRLMNYDSSTQTLYSVNAYNIGSILSYNLATNVVISDNIPGSVPFHNVVNTFIEHNGILYFARWGGMFQYDLLTHKPDSIVYQNASFNSQHENFFDVCKSSNKIYFAGGGKENPYVYDVVTHAAKGLSLEPGKYLSKNYYSNCLCFHNGILYTGMNYGDSIYCYNEITEEKFCIVIPENYMHPNSAGIQSLCVDKKQNLWCGTSVNGIYLYNIPLKKWIKHIGQEEGKFSSSASQLVCDEDGNIWCNGSGGLFVFNTDNFLFKNYSQKDGLFFENSGGYLAVLSNHKLAYNNIYGDSISFGIINTKLSDSAKQTISISIYNLKVLGDSFLTDTLLDNVKQVTLPPNQNAFSLNYAGIAVTEGKTLSYSYLLEGIEKHWHEVGNEQSLSYVNLAPGNYTLHIKCKSRDERIIGTERLLYITMLPAWYQTWLFKLLSTLFILLLLFFAIRYYFQQKTRKQLTILEKERALNEERNRIAADMHDDVGAGLSRIRYITASMKDKQNMNDDDIDKIVSLSDESVEKMNEIIWALNQGNQQLDELIYYTRSQCSEMVNNAGLAFDFELPENIPSKILPWKDCRNIYMLVKEAVNNAIKHASAKKISLHFEMNGSLLIHVKDDGIGFCEDELKRNGNGLVNYKKRVESLKGKYSLRSSTGNGTELIFEIPLAGY